MESDGPCMGRSEKEASEGEIGPCTSLLDDDREGGGLCRTIASKLCSFRSFQVKIWCKSHANFRRWQEHVCAYAYFICIFVRRPG